MFNRRDKIIKKAGQEPTDLEQEVAGYRVARQWQRVLGNGNGGSGLGLSTCSTLSEVADSFLEFERTQMQKETEDESGDQERFLARCSGEGEGCFYKGYAEGDEGKYWIENVFIKDVASITSIIICTLMGSLKK